MGQAHAFTQTGGPAQGGWLAACVPSRQVPGAHHASGLFVRRGGRSVTAQQDLAHVSHVLGRIADAGVPGVTLHDGRWWGIRRVRSGGSQATGVRFSMETQAESRRGQAGRWLLWRRKNDCRRDAPAQRLCVVGDLTDPGAERPVKPGNGAILALGGGSGTSSVPVAANTCRTWSSRCPWQIMPPTSQAKRTGSEAGSGPRCSTSRL